MRFVLTSADFEMMPTGLRRDLLQYLLSPKPGAAEGITILKREQLLALIRNVSFGRRTRQLHDLVAALAYEKDSEAPTKEQLIAALGLANARQLQRNLAELSRLVKRVTGDRTAELARYSKATGSYVVLPVAREILRNLLNQLARSGEGEEPLWE